MMKAIQQALLHKTVELAVCRVPLLQGAKKSRIVDVDGSNATTKVATAIEKVLVRT
jgi:hypothetical protein